jgi:hypothetical protein
MSLENESTPHGLVPENRDTLQPHGQDSAGSGAAAARDVLVPCYYPLWCVAQLVAVASSDLSRLVILFV